MNKKPSGVCHTRATRREADDADHDVFEIGSPDRPSEERQCVHASGLGIDDLAVVVLPPGLVLSEPR